jgi:hypothetical protein
MVPEPDGGQRELMAAPASIQVPTLDQGMMDAV